MNKIVVSYRTSHWRCSIKKAVLKNFTIFTGKHLCWSLFSSLQETPTQVFFYEDCEIFNNTYFENICDRLLLFPTDFFMFAKRSLTKEWQMSWKLLYWIFLGMRIKPKKRCEILAVSLKELRNYKQKLFLCPPQK